MKKIAFAGTLDPITRGHMWVIQEAANIADEVLVMIAQNPDKKTLFSNKEIQEMVQESLKEYNLEDRVKIMVVKGEYVAKTALRQGCEYMIRGVRSATDFDYEKPLQSTNAEVLNGAKTLFVMPPTHLEQVSSSYIKRLAGPVGWHWKIKSFVPVSVYDTWIKKYIHNFILKHLSCAAKQSFEDSQDFMDKIFTAYSQPGRYYHGLEHIAHCFQELEWYLANYGDDNINVDELIMAILSHDVVYNSEDKTMSDEEQSAQWFAQQSGLYGIAMESVQNMVKATAHLSGKAVPQTLNEKLLCSIDLAILAQDKDIYKWYAEGVRKEYSWVPDDLFKHHRIIALEKLLSHDVLYLSEEFAHYEQEARYNLQCEIDFLKGNEKAFD